MIFNLSLLALFISIGTCTYISQNTLNSQFLKFSHLQKMIHNCRLLYHHFYSQYERHFMSELIFWENENLNFLNLKFLPSSTIQFHSQEIATPLSSQPLFLFGKFSACNIDIFDHWFLPHANNWDANLGSDFVLILGFTQENYADPRHNLIGLIDVLKPVVFLYVEDYYQVYLVCIPCFNLAPDGSKSLVPIIQDIGSAMSRITRQWILLHRDMHGINIFSSSIQSGNSLHYFGAGQSAPCALYPNPVEITSSEICIKLLLSIQHNFTISNHQFHAVLFIEKIIDNDNSVQIVKQQKYFAISHGITERKFAFVVIYDRKCFRPVHELFRSLPLWVWITIVVASLGITVSTVFSCKEKSNLLSWGNLHLWLTTFMLMFDQGGWALNHWLRPRLLRNLLMWALWSGVSLIVSNTYKNHLIQSLATENLPIPPKSVRDLVQTKMKVLSTFITTTGSQNRLMLNGTVIPSILNLLSDTNAIEDYKHFQESVVWVDTQSFLQIVLYAIKYSIATAAFNRIVKLERPFAIFDPERDVKYFKQLFEVENSNWVSKPVSEPRSTHTFYWLMSTNYLTRILTKSLAKIYDSGIYHRLHGFKVSFKIRRDIRRLLLSFRQDGGKEDNLMESKNYSGKGKGIHKRVLIEILFNFLACVVFCATVLIFELYFGGAIISMVVVPTEYGWFLSYKLVMLSVFNF